MHIAFIGLLLSAGSCLQAQKPELQPRPPLPSMAPLPGEPGSDPKGAVAPLPSSADSLTVAADVPLRVEITRTIPLKVGQQFQGKLLEAIYGPYRLLLPKDTAVSGLVMATPATDRATRINAKLDGDFTPLREPVVRVTEIDLPAGVVLLPVVAEGGLRNTASIMLEPHPAHRTIAGRIKDLYHQQIKRVHDTLHDPHKDDRVRQYVYQQLPYHPQRVWAGSQFDAVLAQPLLLPSATASPALPHADHVDVSRGTMRLRLTTGLSSKSSKKGDAVAGVLTEPFRNRDGQVMLPTGTALTGAVLQARPARSFGRGGKLRFAFRSIDAPPRTPADEANQRITSSVTAIQGLDKQNVKLDAEGGASAQPDSGRFLVPLLLGAMAVASQDEDGGIARQGVTSNGFGLPARVLSMALESRNLSTAFASFAFSKSIYRRFIARGHEVTFPKHTEMGIALGR